MWAATGGVPRLEPCALRHHWGPRLTPLPERGRRRLRKPASGRRLLAEDTWAADTYLGGVWVGCTTLRARGWLGHFR